MDLAGKQRATLKQVIAGPEREEWTLEKTTRKTAADCVAFWTDAGGEKWFAKDTAFDDEFRGHFLDLHFEAARRQHDAWLDTPSGALALMLLLDQFPRNAFRGTGHMYATDPLARSYARIAIERGFDRQVDPTLRGFFYLPFGHYEDIAEQDYSVELSREVSDRWLEHAEGHRNIVKRFGRFPHRNRILGRTSSEEELQFLNEGGFAG